MVTTALLAQAGGQRGAGLLPTASAARFPRVGAVRSETRKPGPNGPGFRNLNGYRLPGFAGRPRGAGSPSSITPDSSPTLGTGVFDPGD